MIGCNHTSFEWTRAVRHIYGIIRHMQGLYAVMCIIVLLENESFIFPLVSSGDLLYSFATNVAVPYNAINRKLNNVITCACR